jgi:hypothetical protein
MMQRHEDPQNSKKPQNNLLHTQSDDNLSNISSGNKSANTPTEIHQKNCLHQKKNGIADLTTRKLSVIEESVLDACENENDLTPKNLNRNEQKIKQ